MSDERITFRRAIRANVPLIITVAGGTGSGKTYSAMRMARGIAKGQRFAVIDTENGRASHYAEEFAFDVAELHAPFCPGAYADAIVTADAADYPVIVVDSMSHEWAGDGGILDWQEDALEEMAKGDTSRYESCKMRSWIEPKRAHKKMMQKFLQLKAHLILCFRAEPKIEMVKDPKTQRLEVRAKQSLTGLDGWIPITEKNLPYEATVSFLLMPDKPGIGLPIKLQEQHKKYFDLTKPLDEKAGAGMAEWAAGGTPTETRKEPPPQPRPAQPAQPKPPAPSGPMAEAQEAKYLDLRSMLESAADREQLDEFYTGTVQKQWHACAPGHRQSLSKFYQERKKALGGTAE